MHRISYFMVTPKEEQRNHLKSVGLDVLSADIEEIRTYHKLLHIRITDNIVVLTGSNEKNLEIANMLNLQLNNSNIMTIVDDTNKYTTYNSSTDMKVIDIHQIIASHLENEILRPITTHALMDSFGAYHVEEVLVGNNKISYKDIKDIPFPQSGSLVLVRRKNELFIPHGNTRLLVGDLITILGTPSALHKFRELLA